MRIYLKPAMEMEAFEVEDIITASGNVPSGPVVDPDIGEIPGDEFMEAPIIDAVDFN